MMTKFKIKASQKQIAMENVIINPLFRPYLSTQKQAVNDPSRSIFNYTKTNSRRIIIGLGLSRKIGPWSKVQWNLEVRHVGRGRQKGHIPPNVSSVVEF